MVGIIHMPTLNENIAEIAGALIGDGCISRYKTKEGRIRIFLLLSGHSANDLPYYRNTIMPIFKKEFGVNGRLYLRKDTKAILYWIGNKEVIAYFVKLGLPVGKKSSSIRIPAVIHRDPVLLKACIRGIFNTDGCVYRRYSKKFKGQRTRYMNYAVIQFKMKSKPLLEQIRHTLLKMGYKVNALRKVNAVYVLRITHQHYVKLFMDDFSINHPYHLERFDGIVLSPKAPDS